MIGSLRVSFVSFLKMLDPLSMSSPENSASGSCPSLDSPLDRSGPQRLYSYNNILK